MERNNIIKGQYGIPIIAPSTSWKEWKRRLDKGSEKILKVFEPVGKAFVKGIAGLGSNYGTSSVPYIPRTVEELRREEKTLKIRELQVEKAMPYLSPSNHIVAWTLGSFNPKVGQLKIAEWGPAALLASFGVDMVGFKYGPKAVKGIKRAPKINKPTDILNLNLKGFSFENSKPLKAELVLGFIDNDIIPRLKELGHQIESYKPNIRSADFLNDIFDLKMRGENGGAWFSPATNEVTLRGPLENQDFGLVAHEAGGHGIRYNMQPDYKPVSREIINKYLTNPEDPTVQEPLLNSHFGREVFNDFEVNTLGDAYPEIAGYFENFTNRLSGKKLSPEAMAKRILDEQGAVNTQFRAKLSENGKLTGKALDKKIQETPEGVILRMEIEQGYTSMGILERISKITGVSMDELNFYNPASLQNLVEKFPELKTITDKVKYAMTHVAVGTGVMYGLNQYGMVELKKKGGKTHKPFGHRSILDNGWQSTKLLKNKKNVYGK